MAIPVGLVLSRQRLLLLLGLSLTLAPWLAGYWHELLRAVSSIASGLAIASLVLLSMRRRCFWAAALTLLTGLWVAVSPWVLGAAKGEELPLTVELFAGIVVIALALWELRSDPQLREQGPGPRTAA
jgi:hypothetical protein